MISSETITQVREKADIVAVVSEVVPSLKLRGRSFVGLCPFHSEKSPSFHVNRERGFFHCFGCKESGSVIGSVRRDAVDVEAVVGAVGVVIEINASPWRLDLDWRWIRYCMEKGVMLSINPDAHHKEGYYDMHYGVSVARKGGLTKAMTFNALTLNEIEQYLVKRKG